MGEREPRRQHGAGVRDRQSAEGLPTLSDDHNDGVERYSQLSPEMIPDPDELARSNQAAEALLREREQGPHEVFVAQPPPYDEGLPTAAAHEEIPIPAKTE